MTTDSKAYKIIDILTHTISVIEQDGGFKGNSNTGYAGDTPGYRSTKDKVKSFFNNPTPSTYEDRVHFEAKEIFNYFRETKPDDTNEFLTNLYVLAQTDEVAERYLGYVVAMVPTYRKQQEQKMQETEYVNSDYVGVVGKRSNFFLKLISRQYVKSMDCSIFTFIDRRKNLIKTWVDAEKVEKFNMATGDCIDMTAFVRKHEMNKNNQLRETFINRVKIIENKGQA